MAENFKELHVGLLVRAVFTNRMDAFCAVSIQNDRGNANVYLYSVDIQLSCC